MLKREVRHETKGRSEFKRKLFVFKGEIMTYEDSIACFYISGNESSEREKRLLSCEREPTVVGKNW